jgi:hypothetical protein
MTIHNLAFLLAVLGGLSACSSAPPLAPIGLHKMPANPAPDGAGQG